MGKEYASKWLPALGLVILAHAGAWYGLSHLRSAIQPPKPLPVIEVALLAPPPPPQPKVVAKPAEPPKPEPKPKIQRQTAPAPRPLLLPQPEPRPEPVATAAPVAPPLALPDAPTKSAPEPVLEAPRFYAAYLNNPPPAYPLAARRRGIEGHVLVRAEVQPDGSCSRVEMKASSGSNLLDQAALDAVRKWRFVPARKGNQVLTAWVEVPITFKLENN